MSKFIIVNHLITENVEKENRKNQLTNVNKSMCEAEALVKAREGFYVHWERGNLKAWQSHYDVILYLFRSFNAWE